MTATDSLFAEYRACVAAGLDFDEYAKKDRHSRQLIVGGYIADSSLNSMRQYDMAKEREAEAERKRKGKR